jgi:hypothetical protein
MPHLIYVQASGEFFNSGGPVLTPIAKGYSGAGEHKNNPASQCLSQLGPVPRGWYTMHLDDTIDGLDAAIRLQPDEDNEMCGRSGFLIHGDSTTKPGWASEGCIVVGGKTVRQDLAAQFTRLQVLSANMATSQSLLQISNTLADPGPLPFLLGHGYKRYAEACGQRIVERNALTEEVEPTDAGIMTDFGLVATRFEFESAFAADASLAGSFGNFSAEAKASLSKRVSRSATSVSIAFTKRVIKGVYRIAQFPVTSDADRTTSDVHKFLRAYGNEMITGVGVGGACCYLFRFDFATEREATQFKISVGVRYGLNSGSYSQSLSTTIANVKAGITFTGYSTGTTKAPDLFPADVADGTNFLFSRGFGDRMLAGLLDYYDTFQENFAGNTNNAALAQVLLERESLYNLPTIFRNQKKISDEGARAEEIAHALRQQADSVDNIIGQLEYMQKLEPFNRPEDFPTAKNILSASMLLREDIDVRTRALVDGMDLNSTYDFRSRLQALPAHFCTADPETRQFTHKGHGELPNGRWISHRFSIGPNDLRRTCRIHATLALGASRHKPNGVDAVLRLVTIGTLAHPASGQFVSALEPSIELREGETIVEEKKLSTGRRIGDVAATVGPVVFLPADGTVYEARIYLSGNSPYRAFTIVTDVARQLPSL